MRSKKLFASSGSHIDLTLSDADRIAKGLPHVFDFSYTHATLQVVKADRAATCQQVGCPTPPDPVAIGAPHPELGDNAWNDHEFARVGGEVVTFDLPVIWVSTPERLAAVNATNQANGFPVYDAQTWNVEGGGLKDDYTHLPGKNRVDPKGLLNAAKSRFREDVKHLHPDAIEALASKEA